MCKAYLFGRQYVGASVRFPGQDREQPSVQLFELPKSSQHRPLISDGTVGDLHHKGAEEGILLDSSCLVCVLAATFCRHACNCSYIVKDPAKKAESE